MRKDDLVYAGHMLDAAVEALALAEGRTRADFGWWRCWRRGAGAPDPILRMPRGARSGRLPRA
ncbi:MAG: hypothetical protein Q8N47_14030 [Bryobacterales bacterium]|nr:hypothetical protein [Bryobacterales bacterium]